MRNFELLSEIKSRSCAVCGKRPCDPCHIKSVGAGGCDTPENLIAMCRKHHTESHNKGWVKFVESHLALAWHLEQKNWKIIEELGRKRLQHPELGNA